MAFGVWTMSTLPTSDRSVQPPDCPGFRKFPPPPSVPKAQNPVRVPPRARHTLSSEGVFALTCVQSRQVPPALFDMRSSRRGVRFGVPGDMMELIDRQHGAAKTFRS